MPSIADAVFDAALGIIDNSTSCQVRTSASSVLVDTVTNSVTLDGSNFGAPTNGSTGRKIQCLVSAASDMKAISVSSAGTANKVAIGISSGSSMVDYVIADLASSVVLGASDQVNLGTFSVTLADPT